ncbi:MAG: variant-type mycofactocin precursor [Desulfobacca sp.]
MEQGKQGMGLEQELKQQHGAVEGQQTDIPAILEDITVEEMAVDGICGIY